MSKLTLCSSVLFYLLLSSYAVTVKASDVNEANTYLRDQPSSQVSEDEITYEKGELEQLLAPIALYPDTLLSHILIASTYPLEVIEAYRLRSENESLLANEIMSKAEGKDWDPSVIALLPFTRVLKQLHDDLSWTQRLGNAFLNSEKQVLTSIQTLRAQADDAGNLTAMENMDVTHEQNNIVIQSNQPDVIYVPYYDTKVVYGYWPWHYYPPIRWHYPNHYYGYYSPYYWGNGIVISTGFYFSTFHWHSHYVAVDYRYRSKHHGGHVKPHTGGKRHNIIKSGYAKKWSHNPHHRRNVSYRKNGTKTKHFEGYTKQPTHHSFNKKRVLDRDKYQKSQSKMNVTNNQRNTAFVSNRHVTKQNTGNKNYKNTLTKVQGTYQNNKKKESAVNHNKMRTYNQAKPALTPSTGTNNNTGKYSMKKVEANEPIKQNNTQGSYTKPPSNRYVTTTKSYTQQKNSTARNLNKGTSRNVMKSHNTRSKQKRK